MANQQCPRCGREQPETSTSGKCLFCGGEVPDANESLIPLVPPPPPPDEPLAVPPPPVPDATEETEAGKRACPGCGETLYETEERCWRCGHEFEAAPAPEPEPAAAPPPPPLETAAPPAPGLPVPPPAPAVSEAGRQAQVYGIWALVIGLIGLFGCLGLISPLAIYFGIRSNRAASNNLGTVGMVLGFIGTIMLVIAVGVLIAGLFAQGSSSATPSNSPDVLLPCLPLWTHC